MNLELYTNEWYNIIRMDPFYEEDEDVRELEELLILSGPSAEYIADAEYDEEPQPSSSTNVSTERLYVELQNVPLPDIESDIVDLSDYETEHEHVADSSLLEPEEFAQHPDTEDPARNIRDLHDTTGLPESEIGYDEEGNIDAQDVQDA